MWIFPGKYPVPRFSARHSRATSAGVNEWMAILQQQTYGVISNTDPWVAVPSPRVVP